MGFFLQLDLHRHTHLNMPPRSSRVIARLHHNHEEEPPHFPPTPSAPATLNHFHTSPCLTHEVSPAHPPPPPPPAPSFLGFFCGAFFGSNCYSWYPSLNFIAPLETLVKGLPSFKSPRVYVSIICLDLFLFPIKSSKPGISLGPQYLIVSGTGEVLDKHFSNIE